MGSRERDDAVANRFLDALPPASLKRLEPHLEPVDLVPGASLFREGAPTRRLTFINRGLVSIMKAMEDGRTVEIGTIGKDGVAGLFALLGIERAPWEPVVQVPGTGFRVNMELLRDEAEADGRVRDMLERYAHHTLGSLAQTSACHRLHSLTQRLCRWLLSAQDSIGADTVPLTHEALALLLGVQRSGVSIVASGFQKDGALRNNRGSITILDRNRLEAKSCECYATTRGRFAQILAAL